MHRGVDAVGGLHPSPLGEEVGTCQERVKGAANIPPVS